jgi:CheY-like chemotaxis protein
MEGKKAKPLHIMLADDDEDDRMFFRDAVIEINANVQLQTVNDGEELMHLLLHSMNSLPEIIFLDLNMPRKNGFECLAEIRNNKTLQDIFIVIYSTTGSPSEIEETFKKGANLFINKPNNYNILLDTLKRIFILDFKNHTPHSEKNRFVLATNI